jgi:hypothetical protein
MTKRILSLVVGAAILAVVTPLSIAASASEMNCRIPFSFVVNGATLPAGAYSIESDGGVVMLKGAHSSALVLTIFGDRRTDQAGRSNVVFLKTGDRYDLIEIWNGDGLEREVPAARRHVEERARAANVTVERVAIHAN